MLTKDQDAVVIRNILSPDDIDFCFDLWQNSGLQFTDTDGNRRDRVSISTIGHLLVSHWRQDEMQPVIDSLLPKLSEHYPNPNVNDFRILKYGKGCFIQKHMDAQYKENKNTHSIIVQMSPSDHYKGGKAIVNDKDYSLEPGDGLIYDFGVAHEVRPITQGIRYVLHLRFHSTA
jgi:hypothetical protein